MMADVFVTAFHHGDYRAQDDQRCGFRDAE